MQIHSLQSSVDQVYYDRDFMNNLEAHLTYLRTKGEIRIAPVSDHLGYKHEGDLFGLLDSLNILKKFHYIVMRVNGYEHTADFKGDIDYLVIPDLNEVEMLRSVWQTKNSF